MQNHLGNSSAAYKAGISPDKRVFKVFSGQYAGRMVVLAQTSPSEISLAYSDYPYVDWTQLLTVLNDSADYPFDAVMDEAGNIYLVYTLGSNNDLVVRKLTITVASWVVGDLHTIYNGDDNFFPSITIHPPDSLWVTWSRLSLGLYYIDAKRSDDWGENWGTGPSSYGSELSSGASSAYSKILTLGSYIYAVYTLDGTKISYRRKHRNITLWEDEADISTGTGFDDNFDAAVSDDDRLSVVFNDGRIRYREFDGIRWGGIVDVDDNAGTFPQVKFYDNCPYLVYLSEFGTRQNRILYSRKQGNSFSTPHILDPCKSVFDRVLCYNSIVANYSDLTTAAGNDTTGDIYHSDSSVIFKETGDALYLGMQVKFHYLKIILSTAGSGGTLSWQYHNGSQWISFQPSGGGYYFNAPDRELLLWDDYSSIPPDWQKYIVEENNLFWIRIVVASSFDIGPVGTQITSISNVQSLILME